MAVDEDVVGYESRMSIELRPKDAMMGCRRELGFMREKLSLLSSSKDKGFTPDRAVENLRWLGGRRTTQRAVVFIPCSSTLVNS